MKFYSRKIKFVLIVISISLIPVLAAHGSTIYVTWIPERPEPIVDGDLSDSPWSTLTFKGLRLYNFSNEDNYIDIEFCAVFNDTTKTVSFALKIPTTYSNDILKLAFLTNGSYFWLRIFENSPWRYVQGNDQKEFDLVNDIKTDCITTGEAGLETVPDTSLGGTNDFVGEAIYDGTHFNIEITIPQNSGDVIGNDVELEIKNQTQILLWYYDDSTQTTYGQIYNASNVRDIHQIKLSGRDPFFTLPTGIDTMFIIGSLTATFLIVTTIYRRKRIKVRK